MTSQEHATPHPDHSRLTKRPPYDGAVCEVVFPGAWSVEYAETARVYCEVRIAPRPVTSRPAVFMSSGD